MIRLVILFVALGLSSISSQAQAQLGSYSFNSNVLYNDGYGIPWTADFPFLMDGSPFFDTSYCNGSVQLTNGKTYSGLQFKLNLEQQKIIFHTSEGKAFALSQPVARLALGCNDPAKSVVFRSGFGAIDKQNERSLYQVLDSGKVLLLKFVEIRYKDSKAYNSNETTRTYRQLPSYYLWIPGKDLVKVPGDENDLLVLLQDQRKQLLDVILKDKLKAKKETDLIKIINSYNRLLQTS
jgi:hypothetical protein